VRFFRPIETYLEPKNEVASLKTVGPVPYLDAGIILTPLNVAGASAVLPNLLYNSQK